jgi:hypothetical protein
VGAAAIFQSGCPKPIPPQPLQHPCSAQKEGPNLVQTVAARTTIGASAFTLDVNVATNVTPSPSGGTTESQLVVRRNSALAFQADSTTTPQGALRVRVLLADGFEGMKEIVLTSADRVTLNGTIDGRALAPLSIHAKPESMRFSDGSPIPSVTMDADLKQALPLLVQSAKDSLHCASTATPPPTPPGGGAGSDPPGHHSDTLGSAGCIACIEACHQVEAGCIVAAAIGAISCTAGYGACLAAGIGMCAGGAFLCAQDICHVPFLGGGGGGPCCVTACNQGSCCNPGETCVGPNGLCCSPGFKACPPQNCCGSNDTCMVDGTCCPAGQVTCNGNSRCCDVGQTCTNDVCCAPGRNVCNGVCCPHNNDICNPNTQKCCPSGSVCFNSCCDGFDEVCVNSNASKCCARAHACGTSCCATGESCVDANKGTCSACPNCTGLNPKQECCFGQCCTFPMVCDSDKRSCVLAPQ